MKKRENFIEIVSNIHLNKYNYSNVNYINNYTKIEIICPIHGSFWQTPKNHYRNGCKACADADKSNKNFLEQAKSIHNNKYDYSKVKYINQLTPITIICKFHGEFKQLPKVHLNKSGCRKCYDERPKSNKKSLNDFIKESNIIHNDKYEYYLSNYIHNKHPITIICKIHGEFMQTPNSHLRGNGCPSCYGNKKHTLDSFMLKANIIHNNKYDYSLINYNNSFSKIEILCPVHGNFLQIAQDHLSGHGCYKCYKNISKMESDWLDYLKIPNNQEHRNVYIIGKNKKYKVDGLYKNNVYEFYGDFWHGNPRKFNKNDINSVNKFSFGDLYNKTMIREKEIKNLGYKIITIWETEWKAINETKRTRSR